MLTEALRRLIFRRRAAHTRQDAAELGAAIQAAEHNAAVRRILEQAQGLR